MVQHAGRNQQQELIHKSLFCVFWACFLIILCSKLFFKLNAHMDVTCSSVLSARFTSPLSFLICWLNSLPSRDRKSSPGSRMPHLVAMARAVLMLSPVTMRTVMPARWHLAIASGTWRRVGTKVLEHFHSVRPWRWIQSDRETFSTLTFKDFFFLLKPKEDPPIRVKKWRIFAEEELKKTNNLQVLKGVTEKVDTVAEFVCIHPAVLNLTLRWEWRHKDAPVRRPGGPDGQKLLLWLTGWHGQNPAAVLCVYLQIRTHTIA